MLAVNVTGHPADLGCMPAYLGITIKHNKKDELKSMHKYSSTIHMP